jgi:hypothetical protein
LTIRLEDGILHIEGICPVEEAETLLERLLDEPGLPVDWSGCRHLHTAVLQVLMAVRPPLRGTPDDAFLRRWIEPVLARVPIGSNPANPP